MSDKRGMPVASRPGPGRRPLHPAVKPFIVGATILIGLFLVAVVVQRQFRAPYSNPGQIGQAGLGTAALCVQAAGKAPSHQATVTDGHCSVDIQPNERSATVSLNTPDGTLTITDFISGNGPMNIRTILNGKPTSSVDPAVVRQVDAELRKARGA